MHIPDRTVRHHDQTSLNAMEGHFRHWMFAALDGVLLPDQDAQLKALPQRRHQEESSISSRNPVLLEGIDRYMRGVVPV